MIPALACGASFTSIDAGTDIQIVDVYNELIHAASNRYAVLGGSLGMSKISEPDDWHPVVNWSNLQVKVENIATQYVDHTSGSGDFTGNTVSEGFPKFTIANWRAAAGIPSGGFTRWPVLGGTNYGYFSEGDALVDHVIEELQAGIGALQWTEYIGHTAPTGMCTFGAVHGDSDSGSGEDCDDGYNDFVSNWSSETWSCGTNAPGAHPCTPKRAKPLYLAFKWSESVLAGQTNWDFYARSERMAAQVTISYTDLSSAADIYGETCANDLCVLIYSCYGSDIENYEDTYNTGADDLQEIWKVGSVTASTDALKSTTDHYTSLSWGNPFSGSPCAGGGMNNGEWYGMHSWTFGAVLKWVFDYE